MSSISELSVYIMTFLLLIVDRIFLSKVLCLIASSSLLNELILILKETVFCQNDFRIYDFSFVVFDRISEISDNI